MFQNISKKKRKTVEMITNVSCFPAPKEKYPKTSPTNYIVIRGEILSFPRKITTFYSLVTQQEGLKREKKLLLQILFAKVKKWKNEKYNELWLYSIQIYYFDLLHRVEKILSLNSFKRFYYSNQIMLSQFFLKCQIMRL